MTSRDGRRAHRRGRRESCDTRSRCDRRRRRPTRSSRTLVERDPRESAFVRRASATTRAERPTHHRHRGDGIGLDAGRCLHGGAPAEAELILANDNGARFGGAVAVRTLRHGRDRLRGRPRGRARRATRRAGTVVMKFGGTSVGRHGEDQERRAPARRRARGRQPRRRRPLGDGRHDRRADRARARGLAAPASARDRHAHLGRRAHLVRAARDGDPAISATRRSR